MADVFISYKSERRAAAEHLAEILSDYGYSVWWDYGLISGRDFGAQIEKELRSAKAVIVLWCSLSTQSEWVREEAALAKRLNKVIPTLIEKVDLPLGFSLSQTLDLSDWDGAPQSDRLERLLRDVGAMVGRAPKANLPGLDRTERAWRRFGAPPLRSFALIQSLEGARPRMLPGALGGQTEGDRGARKGGGAMFVMGAALVLALLGAGAWYVVQHPSQSNATPAQAVSTAAGAVEAARALQGRWRRDGDTDCTTLSVAANGQLSFTGPGAQPFGEDVVSLDASGGVHTDVAGTPAIYRKDGDALLFTYGSGDEALRYVPCAS